jgi:hypothetical protein
VNTLLRSYKLVVTSRRIFLFAGLLLLFGSISLPFIFDHFPPGEIFRPPIIVVIPLGLAACAFLCTWIFVLASIRLRKQQPRLQSRRTGAVSHIALSLLLVVLCTVGILGFSWLSGAAEGGELQSAKRDFIVVACKHIPGKQIESTLVKLERGVSSLRLKYGVSYAQKHYLYLYPDVETMQRENVETSQVLGFVKYENGDPVIYVPVVPVSDPLTGNRANCTLKHEAFHIVVAEMLGEQGSSAVPCWFQEGMASYEGLNGQYFTAQRLKCKYELWSGATQRTPARILLADHPSSEQVTHAFYLTSSELVRYIVATRGDETPGTILKSLTHGVEFERAFKSACGISALNMYDEWCTEYF